MAVMPQSTSGTDTSGLPSWLKALFKCLGAIGIAGPAATEGGRNFLFGEEARIDPFETRSPEQTQFQNQLLSGLSSNLPQMLNFLKKFTGDDEESFNEYAAPYLRQFKNKIVPSITERFGGGDSGGSSGLQNALAEAGTGLEESLASNRQDQGLRANALFQGMFPTALQPTKGFANIPGQPGVIGDIMKMLPALLAL